MIWQIDHMNQDVNIDITHDKYFLTKTNMQRIQKPATAINFAFFTLTIIGILIISLVFALTADASVMVTQQERQEICSSVLWGHSSENQDIVDQVYGCKNYWKRLVLNRKI